MSLRERISRSMRTKTNRYVLIFVQVELTFIMMLFLPLEKTFMTQMNEKEKYHARDLFFFSLSLSLTHLKFTLKEIANVISFSSRLFANIYTHRILLRRKTTHGIDDYNWPIKKIL